MSSKFTNPGYLYTYQDWVKGYIKTEDLEMLVQNGELSTLDHDAILHIQKLSQEKKEYKYTYQNWVKGELDKEDLFLISNEIAPDDFKKILSRLEEAFLKRVTDLVNTYKNEFLPYYEKSFVKDDALVEFIKDIELKVQEIKDSQQQVYLDVVNGADGRYNLTSKEVEEYLIFDLSKIGWLAIYDLKEEIDKDVSHLGYIVKVNLLKWLYWFREQQLQDKSEPIINVSRSYTEKEIANVIEKNIVLSWPSIFKDPKQSEVVINLISEHLSNSHQWVTEPKGRHIVALFLELKKKGYLKSDRAITNPMMAKAFTKQFGVELVPENFQPKKSELADGYRENFEHIPHYTPTC
jgi:hypothetical protein